MINIKRIGKVSQLIKYVYKNGKIISVLKNWQKLIFRVTFYGVGLLLGL